VRHDRCLGRGSLLPSGRREATGQPNTTRHNQHQTLNPKPNTTRHQTLNPKPNTTRHKQTPACQQGEGARATDECNAVNRGAGVLRSLDTKEQERARQCNSAARAAVSVDVTHLGSDLLHCVGDKRCKRRLCLLREGEANQTLALALVRVGIAP
jgi:hypothetical protein